MDYSPSKFERQLPKLYSGVPEQCPIELGHQVNYGALDTPQILDLSLIRILKSK
jgi:hypothetical protein